MSLNYLSSAERRARTILDAYGSSPARWPTEERQQTQECIAHSTALRAYQAQLAELDQLIQCECDVEQAQVADVSALQQRILNLLPAKPIALTRRSKPLWQRLHNSLFTPRLVAALSVLAVVAVILLAPHARQPMLSPQALNGYEAWSWYDITGQELATVNKPTAMTMTDFIDLETDEDGG